MNWLIVIIIVCYIAYKFFQDRESTMIEVDKVGGMAWKYNELISWIMQEQGTKITRLTRDFVQITYKGPTTETIFHINQSYQSTIVEWVF